MEWTVEHQYTEDIRRLRALLNGETIEGLKLGDPGLDRPWVERTLITREEQLQRLRATPPEHEATITNTPYEDLAVLWELRAVTHPHVRYPVDEERERQARIRTICEHFGVRFPEELLDTMGLPRRQREPLTRVV